MCVWLFRNKAASDPHGEGDTTHKEVLGDDSIPHSTWVPIRAKPKKRRLPRLVYIPLFNSGTQVERWADPPEPPKEEEPPKGRPRKTKVSPEKHPEISPDGDEMPKRQHTEQHFEKIKLTDGIVQEYVNLEKDIYKLERKNVIKKYEAQIIYADNLKNTVEQLEAVLKELRKQT